MVGAKNTSSSLLHMNRLVKIEVESQWNSTCYLLCRYQIGFIAIKTESVAKHVFCGEVYSALDTDFEVSCHWTARLH